MTLTSPGSRPGTEEPRLTPGRKRGTKRPSLARAMLVPWTRADSSSPPTLMGERAMPGGVMIEVPVSVAVTWLVRLPA